MSNPTAPHPATIKAPQKTKNYTFWLPLIGFSHKVNNISTEKQIGILPSRDSNSDCQYRSLQLGSQKFMPLHFLNRKFIKEELKIGYP